MVTEELLERHRRDTAVAAAAYIAGLTADASALDWRTASLRATRMVASTLRASNYLADVAGALRASGLHLTIIRQLCAPPISQDQFSLICPDYPKAREKTGIAVPAPVAHAVSMTFEQWRDKRLTRWLSAGRRPSRREIEVIFRAVVPVLSLQLLSTMRRTRLSVDQEGAVVKLLARKGWTQMFSQPVQTLSALPAQHFMHKTKFATETRPQEVDIACGLGKTIILAMECKVTNDETNSIKRVNDVLKKAAAWQKHWGSFVRTAALLQGVVKFSDVQRLLHAGVEVFWSHNLQDFEGWLDQYSADKTESL